MNVPFLSQFIDNERRSSIELKLTRNYMGNKDFVVEQSSIDEDKISSIFLPLDEFSLFHEKLACLLRSCEMVQDPNQSISKKLCNDRPFNYGPKRYFLNLKEGDRGVFVQINEYNPETSNQRRMNVSIAAAPTLYALLIDAYKIIQSYKGRMPNKKQPRDVLFEKSFRGQEEYSVCVKMSEIEMRHLGYMVLTIKCQNLDNENTKSFIIVRSNGVPLLLQNYAQILHEYYSLKRYSTGHKVGNLSQQHLSKTGLAASETGFKAEEAGLKNRMSS